MRTETDNKSKITPYSEIAPLIVVVFLSVAWFMLYASDSQITVLPDPIDGISDTSNIDFENEIGRLSYAMEFYPLQLYTSEDFVDGNTDEAQNRSDIFEAYKIPYGTFRTVLQLEPNSYYVICGYSIDYGTTVFANGAMVASVGVVSDDPNIAEPCVNYMEFPVYTDEDGILELVIQYSNFVHNEGGGTPCLYISTSENINRYVLEQGLPTYIMSGGLLLLGAYYLLEGIFRKKRIGLHLAFCCLIFALRDQWFYIVSLIPYDYDWNIHYRVIVAIIALTPMAILTMIDAVFPKITHRIVTSIFVVFTLLGTMAMFLVPTTEVVLTSTIVQVSAIPYLIYLFICIIRYYLKKRNVDLKDIYIIFGIIAVIGSNVLDACFNDYIPAVTRGGITPIGMLLFVIAFISVVTIQAKEDEFSLQKSRSEKKAMEQINELKTNFVNTMAHEIKTPLTVMSGYAQLTSRQIEKDKLDENTLDNLGVISMEANRLSNLVTKLINMSYDEHSIDNLEQIDVQHILEEVMMICKQLLKTHNNHLLIELSDIPSIVINHDILLQVLINLTANANKHTHNGTITFKVEENKTHVVFRVIDTGSGIKDEYIDKIFERGFSTSQSSGLGLAICKDIIMDNGGEITLEYTGEMGTSFIFTVPKRKHPTGIPICVEEQRNNKER